MSVYDDADEYCPHCDNHYVRLQGHFHENTANTETSYFLPSVLQKRVRLCRKNKTQVIEAKTPQAMLVAESEDSRIDSR